MTVEERFERIENILAAVAANVAAHDDQIEGLIKVAESQREGLAELKDRMDQLSRDWQAYLTTIHPKQ